MNKHTKLLFYHFEKALTFGFLRKLPFLSGFWDSHRSKAIAAILDKEANAVSDFIMKKLREITIVSPERPISSPPKKKRKLLPSNPSEFENVPPQTDTTSSSEHRRHHKRSSRSSALSNYVAKQKRTAAGSKIVRRLARNSSPKQNRKILPPLNVSSPVKSAQSLAVLFRGCINFVRASKFSTTEDIDLLLKNVTQIGKIISIQDHWTRKDSTSRSRWTGALVTYKQPEDSQKVLKHVFLNRNPDLLAVDVPNHLMLIGHMESRLTSPDPGACIVIEGLSHKTSREKLTHELEQYGEILTCSWSSRNKKVFCEVTFPYVVEAVAAALALDGRCLGRKVVKAGIKMKQKEKYLHMMVCGHYC